VPFLACWKFRVSERRPSPIPHLFVWTFDEELTDSTVETPNIHFPPLIRKVEEWGYKIYKYIEFDITTPRQEDLSFCPLVSSSNLKTQ
jgi:hypothetical protein